MTKDRAYLIASGYFLTNAVDYNGFQTVILSNLVIKQYEDQADISENIVDLANHLLEKTKESEEHILQEAIEILADRGGVKVTAPMVIHSYLTDITNDIASRVDSKDIVLKYNLGIKAQSFATVYKQATNISINDIPKKTNLEVNLAKKGYTAQQIHDIMECR